MPDLNLAAFQPFALTARPDPADDLLAASIVRMANGLQGPAELEVYIPRDVTAPLALRGNDRLVVYDGLTAVHEGRVSMRGFRLGSAPDQGVTIEAPGYWGALLAHRSIDKRWADNRVTADIWQVDDSLVSPGQVRDNRQDGLILFTPADVQFMAQDKYAIYYTMPTGQTIKKITFDYDFYEAAILPILSAFHNNDADGANTFTALTNAIDGDNTTGASFTLTTDDFLYLRLPPDKEIDGLRFDFSAVNNNAATMTLQKFTGKPQTRTPLSVQHDNGGAFTVLTNAFDGNAGTSVNVTLTKDDYLYIRTHEAQIMGFRFDLGGTLNTAEAQLRLQRFNPDTSTWTSVSILESQTETKATNDMKPFAQDGDIMISPDSVTSQVTINGTAGLWWRITPSADLTAVTINEIYTLTGWENVTVSDGTVLSSATFGQDGDMTYSYVADLQELRVNGVRGLWLRMYPSANLDSVTAAEINALDLQAWELRLRDRVGGTTLWSVTANGSGSANPTITTPRQTLHFEFTAVAKQQGHGNGTVYGEISNLMVYSETSDITMYEIALDCVGTLAAGNVLNSTDIYLNDADTPLDLEPFYTIGPESWASILSRAASFGDGDQNEWRAHVRPSDDAPTPNGRPVLALTQYAALTTAHYLVTADELEATVELLQDFASLVNWVTVQYRDSLGRILFLTPDDNAVLKDTISISNWGEQHLEQPLNVGEATASLATKLGQRYLAAHKNPRFTVSGPLRIKGTIRGSGGQDIPVSQIKAGNNIRLENFLEDLAQTTDAGLTFRITRVAYNDATETAEIYTGLSPDAIDILLAQLDAGLSATGITRPKG